MTTNAEEFDILDSMSKNLNHWYDWDPMPQQIDDFDRSRDQAIIDKYHELLWTSTQLEEQFWNLVQDNPKITFAVDKMKEFHAWQTRKIGWIPYDTHPLWVAKIVSKVSQSEQLLIAALLHDVIEDVKNWRQLLHQDFSDEIIEHVDWVSEQDKSLSWKQRKIQYIEHLEHTSNNAIIISLSDRLCNLRDMIVSFEKIWSDMRKNFSAWYEQQKRFLLAYSQWIEQCIATTELWKNKQFVDLYDEFKSTISYFLYLWDKSK